MNIEFIKSKIGFMVFVLLLLTHQTQAQSETFNLNQYPIGSIVALLLIFGILVSTLLYMTFNVNSIGNEYLTLKKIKPSDLFGSQLKNLTAEQINTLLQKDKKVHHTAKKILTGLSLFISFSGFSQASSAQKANTIFGQPGIIITLILIAIPLIFGVTLLSFKIIRAFSNYFDTKKLEKARELANYISETDLEDLEDELLNRRDALQFQPNKNELSGDKIAQDSKGLILNLAHTHEIRMFAQKKDPIKRPKIDPQLSNLILWFLGTAIFWLVLGTTVGEYLGIKFVAPDADHISWLSFGRLRPVHTNLVFWAWATFAIMGLGYYVVPTVSNAPIANIKLGWYSLILVNATIFVGMISLMAGINNGGGEYREIIWPIMVFWIIGLVLTLINFIQTVANRTTKEIYISNWYIIASFIFIIIVAIISYLPFGQNGIGETIIQGYYMHQAVGMWFMFSNLGFLYYFLPQQLNKPIYSYSLGVLAFWSQILFYTLIGTHHFVFSALPWWLQTTAIVGSVGMLIPVTAGTINYLMTFKGDFKKIGDSYSLPFYLVGVIFYFTGSYQGTAEAFRYTNLLWHFSDFTIAHSHITMYGIISFILFASIYAIVPRLTGKEPSKLAVGAHFWLAFVGLLFYTIPLMIGGTLKGLMWMEQKPFIESVILMAPYWLWRAIGGSMMWLAHIVFAFNFYKMTFGAEPFDIQEKAFEILKQSTIQNSDSNK